MKIKFELCHDDAKTGVARVKEVWVNIGAGCILVKDLIKVLQKTYNTNEVPDIFSCADCEAPLPDGRSEYVISTEDCKHEFYIKSENVKCMMDTPLHLLFDFKEEGVSVEDLWMPESDNETPCLTEEKLCMHDRGKYIDPSDLK